MLFEEKSETVRLPFYRRVKHLSRKRIAIGGHDGRFRVKDEAGRPFLIADSSQVDPVQRLSIPRTAVPHAAA